METAGTIAAYLILDSSEFDRGIGDALKLLGQLSSTGVLSAGVFGMLSAGARDTAGVFSGPLCSAILNSSGLFAASGTAVAAAAGAVAGAVGAGMERIKSDVTSVGQSAPQAGQQSQRVADAIRSPIQSLSSDAYALMLNVGAGLNSGLAAKRSAIISTAQGIASSVAATMRRVLNIASPSKVMRRIGEQTAQGLILGLDDMTPDVKSRAQLLAQSVSDGSFGRSPTRGYDQPVGDTALLAGKLDSLISLLSGSEQVMQVDGRAFARLIREYS